MMKELGGRRVSSGTAPTYKVYHDDCLRIDQYESQSIYDFIYLEPSVPSERDGLVAFDDEVSGFPLLDLLVPRVERLLPHLHEMGFLLIHLDHAHVYEVKERVDRLGLPFKGDLIWTYRQRSLKIKALQNHHDTILVYSANPSYHAKRMLFGQSVVAPSGNERTGFPTQKPLELMKRILRRFDEYHRIESVLDPYMGSGTTLVAGFELGKSVVGFDVSPYACRTADRRLHQALPASRQMQLEIG